MQSSLLRRSPGSATPIPEKRSRTCLYTATAMCLYGHPLIKLDMIAFDKENLKGPRSVFIEQVKGRMIYGAEMPATQQISRVGAGPVPEAGMKLGSHITEEEQRQS